MSWNKDDLQRQMDEHTASIEKFTIAPNAMQNIPQNLRPDLLARMDYLLGGITGDMQEGEYAYVKRCPIKGIDISDDQIKTLNKYYRRTYNKMSRIVLDCANQENEDWRKLVKILVNSEIYFRKQLSDSQLQQYKKALPSWKMPGPELYMNDDLFHSYIKLTKRNNDAV